MFGAKANKTETSTEENPEKKARLDEGDSLIVLEISETGKSKLNDALSHVKGSLSKIERLSEIADESAIQSVLIHIK